ncbi:mRNA-binding ribosome synthesis protein [Ancistrocladus abbreviatus]
MPSMYEGLMECVEQTVRDEHASSPNKPIYLVGDSFGGCLALAVAAHHASIDLVLILANPATSLESFHLRPFFPLLEDFPGELHTTIPYLLSFIMGICYFTTSSSHSSISWVVDIRILLMFFDAGYE